MTAEKDAHLAQASVFCVELHRAVEILDISASSEARKFRTQMGLQGARRKPAVINALQEQLRVLATERQLLMDMLAALGHSYPCRHWEADDSSATGPG